MPPVQNAVVERGRKMKASPFPMIEPEEAIRLIAENVASPAPSDTETVALIVGKGWVLAEDIYSTVNIPTFDTTPIDGYALFAEEGRQEWQVIGEHLAGETGYLRIEAGTAIRIMNGAPLPEGANSVVMVEFTNETDNVLSLSIPVKAGDNIRHIGQDIKKGQLVLKAGTVMGAPELGLAAMVNRASFKAYRRPRLGVISVGDEIAEPGDVSKPEAVYDSNRFSLVAALTDAYAEAIPLGIAPASKEGLRTMIMDALEIYDGVVTSGSLSVGKTDIVKDLLEELGTIHFGRVNLKPGKPFTFVTAEINGKRKPIFGLPGSPVSSLVSFELFVRPAVLKMGGRAKRHRPTIQVQAEHAIAHAADRNEYVRAIVSQQFEPETRSYTFTARTTGAQNSSRLMSMLEANALLRLSPDPHAVKAGSYMTAVLLNCTEI
ncbi:gephyrin-like molybdotransferase Glp [Candidatus Chlorohelix sp.]|uniref:molybdopterin molybdotransferase MoeA n=1 Tax=Candidatus Chlorohelix sp. TaxID=3139201 RepID=UPI00305BA6F4